MRILRLLRLTKLQRIIRRVEQRVFSGYILMALGLAKLICSLVFVVHIVACAWYALGKSQDVSWLSKYVEAGHGKSFMYTVCLHWSLTQFHGSTDVMPVTRVERLFCAVVLLFSLLVFSSFLSKVTNLTIELSALQEKEKRQTRELNEYLEANQISVELAIRARAFLAKTTRSQNSVQVITQAALPLELVMDLQFEAHNPFLRSHPLFSAINMVHSRAIRHACHDACKQNLCLHKDEIFVKDDPCDSMLIVMAGKLEYCCRRARQNIAKGEWLCEPVLWTPWVHRGSAHTVSSKSTLLYLSAVKLASTMVMYEAILGKQFFANYGRAYLRELSNYIEVSDCVDFNVDVDFYVYPGGHCQSNRSSANSEVFLN
eukprot:TRINITY_DN50587_c0_g1_i1.p1 TRINITY_DN50587_c0_g1~~TRINITY_DN50587_c0_g1_i1.p1  ORF type:complete len:423 (-),score=52.82 TRINITY_DN50587_c0_g1_i1:252-1367(-)